MDVQQEILKTLEEILWKMPERRVIQGMTWREVRYQCWLNSDEYPQVLALAKLCVNEQERIEQIVPEYREAITNDYTNSVDCYNLGSWMVAFFDSTTEDDGFDFEACIRDARNTLLKFRELQTVEQIQHYIEHEC